MTTKTAATLLTITRGEAFRMVGIAHRHYEWEVAEFVTRLAMMFGPEPLGDEAKENDVVVLDRLTSPGITAWTFHQVASVLEEARM